MLNMLLVLATDVCVPGTGLSSDYECMFASVAALFNAAAFTNSLLTANMCTVPLSEDTDKNFESGSKLR